jgi:hypothetical protein
MTTPAPASLHRLPWVLGMGMLVLAGCAGTPNPGSSPTTVSVQAVTTTAGPEASGAVPTSELPPQEDPAAVTTGGRVIESIEEARRIYGDGGDASLPDNFLHSYVTDHGDDYAGYAAFGGADGVTDGVLYLLASDPVISDNLQEGIDLARARGMTITVEERELSYNELWGVADRVASDPDWPRAVITHGIDVQAGEAVVGLDDRLDPADLERIRSAIVARYAPHVRVKTVGMMQTGDGTRAGTTPTG